MMDEDKVDECEAGLTDRLEVAGSKRREERMDGETLGFKSKTRIKLFHQLRAAKGRFYPQHDARCKKQMPNKHLTNVGI